jgi:hypothetical protein
MAFTGTLHSNEIYSALFNMIISQEVFAGNIKGTYSSLVNQAKTEGTLYGDTKLYYATDALKSHAWTDDLEAAQLLSLDRPEEPKCQAITIDKFRQIRLTVDNYLSKRAWSDEGAFSSFNGVMLGWIKDTKKIYDSTYYNTYIGTAKGATDMQQVEIDLEIATSELTGKERDEAEAKEIARRIADLLVAMKDVSRDYNDYEFLRSYDDEEIKIIWNSEWVNRIRKIDLPTIFHKEGLVDKFAEEVLPARYFGNVETKAGKSDGTSDCRTLVEMDTPEGHIFPGDMIPENFPYNAGEAYFVDSDVICKVLVKLPPYMSAFEVGTSFFNPRSLTENHYLTFGHNTLEYLKGYPMITVKAVK